MKKRLYKKGERKKPTKKFYEERFKKIPEGMQFGDFTFTRKTLEWRCAFSAKSKARRNLPKYMYVSNQGHVISVYKKEEPKLLRNYNNKDKYTKKDKYARIGKGKSKNNDYKAYGLDRPLYISHLVALCFDCPITPAARILLAVMGFDAFGNGSDMFHIKVHHRDKNTLNNTPSNLVIMTCLEHSIYHYKWIPALKKWYNEFWDTKSEKLSEEKQREYNRDIIFESK